MPNIHGPRDAVAVEASISEELNSAYTFLLEHIIVLVWTLIVYFGVLTSIRSYEKRHPDHSIAKELFAGRSSPFEILKVTFKRIVKPTYSRWRVLLWLLAALAFLVLRYAIPIIFAKYIIIGNAAPVNPLAIYMPSIKSVTSGEPKDILAYYALGVPSVLRAMGSVGSVNSTKNGNSSISIDLAEPLPPNPATQDPNQRINYAYNVTGEDMGLQHYPDLTLYVEGSCVTDYSWYLGPQQIEGAELWYDAYAIYNDASNVQRVSLYDGNSPVATFLTDEIPAAGPISNHTWAAIISSVNRTSYYPSTDPWYLTTANDDPTRPPYRVKEGRPALSCWQNDVWSYKGANSSIKNLTSTALPGLQLAGTMQIILARYLGTPYIQYVGSQLSSSALLSAPAAVSLVFNANASSLYSDLERLVFASSIGTANTLTETTLFPSNPGIANDILDNNGSIPPGADGFVIYSKDVTTLSVKALILIPVIALTLWILTIAVLFAPFKEMKALVAEIKEKRALAKKDAEASDGEEMKATPEHGGVETLTEKVAAEAIKSVTALVDGPAS